MQKDFNLYSKERFLLKGIVIEFIPTTQSIASFISKYTVRLQGIFVKTCFYFFSEGLLRKSHKLDIPDTN